MSKWPIALALGLAILPAGGALAQGRPLSTAMTCGQAAGLVNARGAVVMSTGRFTYDRYVQHRGFCTPSESILPEWVPTRDTAACFVGYRCIELLRGRRS